MRTEKANETPKQLAMNLLGQVLGARPAEPRTTLPKNGSKTPRLNRYAAIQRLFEADIFGNKQLVDTRTISSSGLTYNFVDLFAGAGGLSLGFEQANFHGVAAIEV